jgi:osmotically-inducible protein OsmY
MGMLNATEKELVSSVVRKTSGVKLVITVFESKSVDA